ncbi:MAG: cell division protein ZapA [Desulfobulbaceae bacterium]|nr:cell division protein ZapA [Desulfobulbaceae bacterium]
MQERPIRFHLFGQEFTFFSDAEDEEIEQVITLLKNEFADNKKVAQSMPPSTTSLVFGCLRLAAKLVQERDRQQALEQHRQRAIARMMNKVVSHLD